MNHRSFPLAIASALLCVLPGACSEGRDTELDASLVYTVGRGDIVVTVRERGELEAARDTRIRSEVEGRATLIHLIPEGTVVKAGDKLAELDVSGIEEKRAQQAISVAKVEAALQQARKTVEIVEKELSAAEKTAETRLEIARLRLSKFVGQMDGVSNTGMPSPEIAGTNAEMTARLEELLAGDGTPPGARANLLARVLAILGSEENLQLEMGELANMVLQQIDAISLAMADLELANETLFHSRKLAAKGFITANELERDEINYKRELSKQTVAWNDLLLLVNYSLPETLLSLGLEVENSVLGLESVRAASGARRVRESAELQSIEAEHGLALQQLANWEMQIDNGVLYAPAPGLVVYGRWDWDEPVYEGMEVRERQEVVILPDVSTMVAVLKIPEAQIGRVAVGQRARILVDAFPSQTFMGRVEYVSTLPDPGPRSQTLKVFVARVQIDGDNTGGSLRPGMNGTVTIDVGTIRDVVNVPLPALERRGDAHYVWKVAPEGPSAVPVTLGGHNLTHVEIATGLKAGDRVYLVRPPGAQLPGELERAEPERSEPPSDVEVSRGSGASPAGVAVPGNGPGSE